MLRRVWCLSIVHQSGSSAIVGDDRLEVSLENEHALSFYEKDTTVLRYPGESFAHERRVLSKVLRHDGSLPRWSRMVTRVREAREALQKHLELEKMLDLAVDLKVRQP
jgi:hypothetical protein